MPVRCTLDRAASYLSHRVTIRIPTATLKVMLRLTSDLTGLLMTRKNLRRTLTATMARSCGSSRHRKVDMKFLPEISFQPMDRKGVPRFMSWAAEIRGA